MPRKEMTVDESIRMTKRPYRNNFNLSDYSAEEAAALPNSSGYTYTGEGASSKAGAGRGVQGGPTAAQLKAQDVEDTRASVEKARAETKGVSVDQMRKGMSDEYDRKMKAGEFYKKGGMTASARADGIAVKGKTRGKMV